MQSDGQERSEISGRIIMENGGRFDILKPNKQLQSGRKEPINHIDDAYDEYM